VERARSKAFSSANTLGERGERHRLIWFPRPVRNHARAYQTHADLTAGDYDDTDSIATDKGNAQVFSDAGAPISAGQPRFQDYKEAVVLNFRLVSL